MPKLTINDTEIDVEPGTSILQAAELAGYEIPRFCYHDRLSVPANCRMCLVEVEGGPPKPVASCAMACGEGMVVKTESEMVQKARKGVMEFLLINHPLDCPICDQGGECDLQDQAVAYGFDRSRYDENKRAVPNKNLGPLIKTIMTRCIQCTRCVRFGEEVAGVTELGLLNRGEDVEIGTFIEKAVSTELSGNMIDICPVGALTSKPYAFKARPWELRKTETIDVMDAVGSNIRADARGREVMRILPRLHEDINEEWISDKTRFAYDGLNYKRLDRPYIRDAKSGALKEAGWDEAFTFIAEKLDGVPGGKMAALAGDLCDLESMVALKDLMEALGSQNIDCQTDGVQMDTSKRAGYLFNSGIAGIDEADSILLIGTNPRWEAPIINARIRKAWVDRRVPIGLVGEAVELTYPYHHAGDSLKDLEAMVKDHKGKVKSQKPMMIVGSQMFEGEDGPAIQALLHKAVEDLGCVADGWNGFNVLHRAASRVGGYEIGFAPNKDSKGFAEIIEGTKSGDVEALYLLGADEFDARKEIGWKTFVIYQGHHGDAGAARADVILPGAAYTEKAGVYINTEGRPQLARKASSPPGEAREDWAILRALSDRLGKTLPYDTDLQLRGRIAKDWPHLMELDDITPAKWTKFGSGKISATRLKESLTTPIKDFYQTNVIARASKTMRECSLAFTPAREDIPQAAE